MVKGLHYPNYTVNTLVSIALGLFSYVLLVRVIPPCCMVERCSWWVVHCCLSTDITHLFEVFEIVRPLTDWMRFGLALGLHYPTLLKIKRDHSIIDECKLEMLAAWLQQQDGVSQQGVPSLAVLKAALRRIGENMIADKISLQWWGVNIIYM